MAVPTIASGALKKMLATAGRHGVDVDAVLAQVGVARDVLDDRDGRVPIPTFHAAWDAVLARAPRARSIFAAAQAFSPADYGIVGFVVMTSATFAEALHHFVRYIALWTDEPAFTLRGPAIVFAYKSSFADGPARRAALEEGPAEIVHGARLVAQKHVVPREVRFVHEAPEDVAELEAFFGCPLRFGADDNALVFRDEDMTTPLPRADPQLGAFLRKTANEALERRGATESPLDRVREIIAEELSRGVPALSAVARRMATSERTLRRRLEDDGTSFRELLDDTRARLARSYVRDRTMPLSQVAFMLGFSEPSAFHRAFKRWTQTTPAAYRTSG